MYTIPNKQIKKYWLIHQFAQYIQTIRICEGSNIVSIRDCAKKCKAFSDLYCYYNDREKGLRQWKKEGKEVVGQLGYDVPDELIIAADMLPVRIYADPNKKLDNTDKYLEYAFDPVVRAQFEKLVDGTYKNQIDYLAASNSTDVIIRVYVYLREIIRSEPEVPVPPVAFIDWLFTRNRMYQERNEQTMQLFRRQMETWAEHSIDDAKIRNAAEICNANRAALREMAELRHGKEVRINGSEALVIIGSAFFMERQEHTRLVKLLLEDAKSWPVIDNPRIYITGSAQESTELYELIENAGGVIVGEDHDWGDRFFARDMPTDIDPIKAIVDRYMLREFSSKKAFVSQRVDALNRGVKETDAQAVLFYMNIYEEAASWDYPSQKASLEDQGIKTAAFVKMLYPVTKNEGLQSRLDAFVESLKGGRP